MKLIASLLAVCVLLAGTAHAGGAPKRPKPPTREIKVEDNKPHMFRVSATKKSGEKKDKSFSRYDFQFTTDGFPRWRAFAASKDATTKGMFKFRLGLLEVVEYEDAGAGLTSKDQIVSRVKLHRNKADKALAWSDIVMADETADGVTVKTISTSLTDGTSKLTLDTGISGETVEMTKGKRTERFAPNKFKWSMTIDEFPYKGNNTKLAVVAKLQTKSKLKEREELSDATEAPSDDDEEEVELGDTTTPGAGGFFSWVETADADGTSVAVTRGKFSDTDDMQANDDGTDDDGKDPEEATKFVVFMFDAIQPKSLRWDPETEVMDSASARPMAQLLLLAVSALFALAFQF